MSLTSTSWGKRPGPAQPIGLYYATVTRFGDWSIGRQVWIRIDTLMAPNQDVGPCDILDGWWTVYEETTVVQDHDHAPGNPLKVGDRVIIGFVEGNINRPLILGRAFGSA